MVKTRLFILALLATVISVTFVNTVMAQQRQYYLGHEWAKIWINQNGSIDLFYNISLTLDSGTNITYVFIGQPQGGFSIDRAVDQYGNVLLAYDASSGTDYRVRVNLKNPLKAGQTIVFNLTTNVPQMIYEDSNASRFGMQFIPTWWTEASVLDLRISIVLPAGVTKDMVKTTNVLWNNTLPEDSRLAIYWQKQNLLPNAQYPVGLSFPKEFLPNYQPPANPPPYEPPAFPPTGITPWQPVTSAVLVLGVIVALIGVVAVVVRKSPYLIPSMSMETLGIKHGLTAVEASYLLDQKPTKIVTEILYSLLQKRAVWVEAATPSLKLRIMQPFQDKTGPKETPLRYYEIDFLHSIRGDGTLDEERLARTIMTLRDTIEEKMRGYCRRDTIDYYKGVAAKAWEQVEQAGTPELASKAYDEQLLWLFLDPNYQSRTEFAFRNRSFEPSPFWLWYWYSYKYYHPNPTYKPNVEAIPPKVEAPTKTAPIPAQMPQPQTQVAKPPTIPGSDFANNMVKAVENTSNNIVASLEKFANAIIPAPPPAQKASNQPAHHASSCVCACAACACVCACVSCACACASGGVG